MCHPQILLECRHDHVNRLFGPRSHNACIDDQNAVSDRKVKHDVLVASIWDISLTARVRERIAFLTELLVPENVPRETRRIENVREPHIALLDAGNPKDRYVANLRQ